jgi:Zn-dependent M28 family amino/carboxypeptidase
VYAIYNGADDNASGTAALLELARRIALRPLERDVVFVWFGAEELGMVGSRWLVAHRTPAISAANAVAMLNMDMIGRLRDCRLFVESRETAHGFAALIDDVSRGTRLDTRPWEPSRGPWGASDHMAFIDARVPSLFLFTGLHGEYHRPTDDLPTLNLQGLGTVVGFAESLVRNLDAAVARAPGDFTFRAPGAAR